MIIIRRNQKEGKKARRYETYQNHLKDSLEGYISEFLVPSFNVSIASLVVLSNGNGILKRFEEKANECKDIIRSIFENKKKTKKKRGTARKQKNDKKKKRKKPCGDCRNQRPSGVGNEFSKLFRKENERQSMNY